jgi:hypothetical protein
MEDLGGLAVHYMYKASDRHEKPDWWSGLEHDDKHFAYRICDSPCNCGTVYCSTDIGVSIEWSAHYASSWDGIAMIPRTDGVQIARACFRVSFHAIDRWCMLDQRLRYGANALRMITRMRRGDLNCKGVVSKSA